MIEQPKRERIGKVIKVTERFNPIQSLVDEGAEKALIGAVLFEPTLYPSLSDICQPADFYSLKRGLIWWAFDQVYPDIDTHTVMRAMISQVADTPEQLSHELDSYLLEVPDINHAEVYAHSVLEGSIRARMFETGAKISHRVSEGGNIDELIDDCNHLLFVASNQRNGQYETSIQQIVSQYMDRIEQIRRGEWSPVVHTGYLNLDNLTGGLGVGEVTVLAGGAGMGKTTLALCMVLNLLKRRERVVFFSLEMSQTEVVDALASILTGIPPVNIKRKEFLNDDQFELYLKSLGDISTFNLDVVTEFPALTPVQLRRKLRTLEASGGPIKLCVIDGLWLMEASEPSGKDWIDVHHIMRDLTYLAGVEGFMVPILLLHQYTGDVKDRGDKTPRVTDMAGGRAVERTAQNVWAMYSDTYYHITDDMDITKLYLLKNRMSGVRNDFVNFLFRNRRYIEA